MEIIFEKVSYIKNKKKIIKDISFSMSENKIYSFIGPCNSGKNIILKLISSLDTPFAGKIKIDSKKIGYVLNNPFDMFLKHTVFDELNRISNNKKRIIESLKIVSLDESYLEKNITDLNLIDAKKIALSCALINNPKIIILDEIENGLSNVDKNNLIRLFRILKNKYKKTIILLSKNTSFCYQIVDYVYLMNDGCIIKEGGRKILEDESLLQNNNIEPPKIVSFINTYNKKGRELNYYNNILDLIKAIYRDMY